MLLDLVLLDLVLLDLKLLDLVLLDLMQPRSWETSRSTREVPRWHAPLNRRMLCA
jgi:hypothetical protein